MTMSDHDDRTRSVDAPRLAGWLLRRVLSHEAAEALLGDLVEEAPRRRSPRVVVAEALDRVAGPPAC